jgi:hypothetical protein
MQSTPSINTNSLFSNFVYNKPTDKALDARTLVYCIPLIRSVIRIATALTTINKTPEPLMDNLQKKKVIIDVIKWAATSLIVDIIPIAFIPFLGTIAAIAGLFALIATCFEIKPIVEFLAGPNTLANVIAIAATTESTTATSAAPRS